MKLLSSLPHIVLATEATHKPAGDANIQSNPCVHETFSETLYITEQAWR
jgi:hypothetical protein